MLPKIGNAFAQRKEAERVEQMRTSPGEESSVESTEHPSMKLPHNNSSDEEIGSAIDHKFGALFQSGRKLPPRSNVGARRTAAASPEDDIIKTTTLQVPATQQNDAPSAGTTMSALLGPETEQEKRGRQMVKQQRESMEAKVDRKRSHKSHRSTDSSRTTIKHQSAMPAPLFRGKFDRVKNMFKKSGSPSSSAAALDKPLPAISGHEAGYTQARDLDFSGAYVPPPASIHDGTAMQGGSSSRQAYSQNYIQGYGQGYSHHSSQYGVAPVSLHTPVVYHSQDVRSQLAYPEQGWPLPQGRTATGHLSTQTFETNPSQYLRTGNEGMIFSNHFLTPTRAGDFATFGQPKVVHPPSMMSMTASFVDPQSPMAVQRVSNLGVVPEVQETRELQAAAAADVEKLYNRGAEDSQSENSPFQVRRTVAADAPVVSAPVPRLPRAHSLPNMHFISSPAAATITPADQGAANTASTTVVEPVTAAMLDQFYLQGRSDLKFAYFELARGIKHSRRAIQHDLVILDDKIVGLERNDTFAFLEQRMHTLNARTQRMEDKLDALIDALRSVGVGAGARTAAAGGRGGMDGRLGAPGPHVPWGSQSLNGRDREPSAGIGGGLEGAQAWYRAARRA